MFWKVLALVLLVLLVAETGYIFTRRSRTNRFHSIAEYEGLFALDTDTGRMCKTMNFPDTPKKFESTAPPPPVRPNPIPNPASGSAAVEDWLKSVRNNPSTIVNSPKEEAEDSTLFLFRTVPPCWDIR